MNSLIRSAIISTFRPAAAAAAEVDTNFANTVLLLHGDGTNGAQNQTFLDSGTANTGGTGFTITRNGNTTQGTFSPFSQTGWSNYFDGTGDYLTATKNSAYEIGSGDFTVEAWIYPTAGGALYNSGILSYGASSSTNGWLFGITGSNAGGTLNRVMFEYNYDGTLYTSTAAVALNSWNHVAVSRSGSNIYVFLNGNLQSTTSTSKTANTNASDVSVIGSESYAPSSSDRIFTGYISNLRLVKGTAVYTANFTPSTAALTAITNTSLLTCQSNRFVDNSTNAFTVTRVGNTSVQAFSPFAPTAAYSAGTNGGSGYFDGTGDYLSMTSGTSLGSGDFTISCWVYLTAAPGAETSVGSTYNYYTVGSNGNFVFRVGTENLWYSFNGQGSVAGITGSFTWQLNTWIYMAWVRSGSTVTVYRNGVSLGSTTDTKTLSDSANGYVLGADRINGSIGTYMTGYISGFRILVGTADTAVPTAPPTAITNTQLLLNFTNAGITDATAKNDLETVGNAQISTTQAKFGGGSIYFDGTGDRLTMRNTPLLRLSSSEAFTIEFWVYANALSSDQHLIHAYNQASPYEGWGVGFGSGGVANTSMAFWDGTTWRTIKTGFSTGTWYHIAITSEGSSSTGRFFVNGTQEGSAVTFASTIANSTTAISIGATPTGNDSNVFIDDLRITKGKARYTANFTAPTKAFADQ